MKILFTDNKTLLIRSCLQTTRSYQSCYSCMFYHYHNKSFWSDWEDFFRLFSFHTVLKAACQEQEELLSQNNNETENQKQEAMLFQNNRETEDQKTSEINFNQNWYFTENFMWSNWNVLTSLLIWWSRSHSVQSCDQIETYWQACWYDHSVITWLSD